ncbi:LOW QUALITY PROTEIN: Putative aryl-alcohol dehydrogenase [Saitozyma sp. JCM 24511]|nr:LOW QUALITY PROTEIN: Putative aryl-alcohol dehydrogenase [Saitozyma sp. JCM 24511]
MSQPEPTHKMKYINLGKSGLKVSKLILGLMTYGSGQEWMIADHDEGIRQIKYAYDQGINTFDTANVYSAGESEVILGKFLKQHKIPREGVVILTKTFGPDGKAEDRGPAGLTNHRGLSRKARTPTTKRWHGLTTRIFASVKGSLERLGLDYIDVLQCHRFDYETPIGETMQALHDVVQAGWVRYIGMSSCWAWQFQLMQQYALQNRLTPFISMQNQHSALYREEEREMMPMLNHFGVGVIPWGPLGAGRTSTLVESRMTIRVGLLTATVLCRPVDESQATKRGQSQLNDGRGKLVSYSRLVPAHSRMSARVEGVLIAQPSDQAVIKAVEAVAKRKGVSMAEVAVAWSLQSEWVTAPIVGVRSTERLDELIKGLDVELTKEDKKEIEKGYMPVTIRGHT